MVGLGAKIENVQGSRGWKTDRKLNVPEAGVRPGPGNPHAERLGSEPLPDALRNYELWSGLSRLRAWEMTRMRNALTVLDYRPKISLLLPVYNPKRAWLVRALDSVMSQAYPNWELCICDDASTEVHIKEVLELYARLDERITVRYLEENANIVGATNQAFSLASGEFVGLLDHDDALAPNALFEVVALLQEHPEADLIYTDEDKIDEEGTSLRPLFKPGWSPDLALSGNYLVHLSVYRRAILEDIGGWREGLDGAQDLDVMLRYTERTDRIHHIPKVLYHWRAVEGSVALNPSFKSYTHERARQAIQDALERRGVRGEARDTHIPNCFRVDREIEGQPRVSVLIPVREGADHSRCVESVRRRTTYPNYEVSLVTTATATSASESSPGSATVIRVGEGHTPLELCNAAIRRATGEYIVFLDPDLEVLSDGWLEALLQHAQREDVGAVGGKLVSREGHILQAGLILDPEEGEDSPQTFYRPFNRPHTGFRMFLHVPRNCSAVSQECIVLRKNTFEAIGGFDSEHLESEFGDVDLCLRLREEGYLIVYTPFAEFARHNPEPTTGLGPERSHYVRERWEETLRGDPYYNPNLRWNASLTSTLGLLGLDNPPRVAARRSRAVPTERSA